MKFSYKKSGVDYKLLDSVKRLAQANGLKTGFNFKDTEFNEVVESRGESAYVLETKNCYYAFVTEGLGTKNLIADEMGKLTGKSYYSEIAQDTVAMIVNDLITVGAKPLTVSAYWAVGDTNWWSYKKRAFDLISGWRKACDMANCGWGGGETPTLKGIIKKGVIDLAGSGYGIIRPKERFARGNKLKPGDAIIIFESSGIHANGLTLARKLGYKLTDSFKTKLPNGKMYGEELLTPTIIYSRLIQDLLDNGIDIHYMVNITGHGWRKLMRAKKAFSFVIDNIPQTPDILNYMQKHSGLSDKEMYATFNMGAGFAIFIPKKDTGKVIKISKKNKIKVWIAGKVEKGLKQIYIKPKNILYTDKDLNIRQTY